MEMDWQHFGREPGWNIMKVWKDWSIENPIAVIEEARRPSSLKQYIPAEENCPDVADTSQDLQQS